MALGGGGIRSASAAELPFTPQVYELANGLRLVTVPFESPGIVAIYSVVRVGSRDEVRRSVSGFAHFFEHMMSIGTQAWPKERVRTLLMEAGGDQSGFTTDDFTCYTFVGDSAFSESWIEYEADRFQRLKYSVADFRATARALLGEYHKSSLQVYLPLMERLRAAVYKSHPYGRTAMGSLASIERMPRRYASSLKFLRHHYTPDNTNLIVVGDFDRASVIRAVERSFGRWKGRKKRVRVRRERRQRREVRVRVNFPARTLPHLSLSWRTPRTNFDSSKTAVYNILYELMFGEASSLYRTLVLKRAVVARFQEWSWNHRDPYFFQVVAMVNDAKDLRAVENKILAQVKRLRRKGPTAGYLETIKENVRYRTLMDLDTPDRVARMLAYTIGASGRVDGVRRRLEAIERLTTKDVRRFFRKYLRRRNRAVVTVLSTEDSS